MNFIKEAKKPILIYLFVYLVIIAICGLLQFSINCNLRYSICFFNTDHLNTIITTTSYVLTPLIAIIGFQSWREAENYKNAHKAIDLMLDSNRNLQKKWHLSREYGEQSLFQDYYIKDVANLKIYNHYINDFFPVAFKKSSEIFEELNDLKHLAIKLAIYQKSDLTNLNNAIFALEDELYATSKQLWEFYYTLISNSFSSKDSTLSKVEMDNLCQKFDRYCNVIMANKESSKRIDYGQQINDYYLNISVEIDKIAKNL